MNKKRKFDLPKFKKGQLFHARVKGLNRNHPAGPFELTKMKFPFVYGKDKKPKPVEWTFRLKDYVFIGL